MGSGVAVGYGVTEFSGVSVGSGAEVGAGVSVGSGTAVGSGAVVGSGTEVGFGVFVGSGFSVESGASVGSGVTEGCTSVFFACSNAILDASRIPIEENVAPLTVSIPSVLCFSSILGCMDLHALLKKLLVSEFVLVTSVIFPSLIVSVMLTFPEYPIADPV